MIMCISNFEKAYRQNLFDDTGKLKWEKFDSISNNESEDNNEEKIISRYYWQS